jgi:hypothetical protein
MAGQRAAAKADLKADQMVYVTADERVDLRVKSMDIATALLLETTRAHNSAASMVDKKDSDLANV